MSNTCFYNRLLWRRPLTIVTFGMSSSSSVEKDKVDHLSPSTSQEAESSHHRVKEKRLTSSPSREKALKRYSSKRKRSSSSCPTSDISATNESDSEGSKHKKRLKKQVKKKSKRHHSSSKPVQLSKYMKERSSITGKVIKMKVKKSSKDKEREKNRKQLLNFLNSSL